MRDRAALDRVKVMLKLQKARRCGADDAMRAARAARRAADDAADAAHRRCDEAHADWRIHIEGAVFDPAFGRWLGDTVLARVGEGLRADAKAECARANEESSEREWQRLEAQVRTTEKQIARGSHRRGRSLEQKRQAAAADRVTQDWPAR